MNENINLCEILKGLEGIELYSTILGIINLKRIKEDCIIVENDEGYEWAFNIDGKYTSNQNAECIIFPAKSQRDWSKFERPIPIDTPMMCRNKSTLPWTLYKYIGKIDDKHCVEYYSNSGLRGTTNFNYMIPFDKFNPNDIEESLKYNIQK